MDTKNWPNSPYLPRTPFDDEFDRMGFAIDAETIELRRLYDNAATPEEWGQIQDEFRRWSDGLVAWKAHRANVESGR